MNFGKVYYEEYIVLLNVWLIQKREKSMQKDYFLKTKVTFLTFDGLSKSFYD